MPASRLVHPYGSGGGGGSTSIPAQIVSGIGIVYNITLYANGKTQPSTGSGTTVVLNMDSFETLPVGSWIMVSPTKLTYTGG
jgi:hypothetical protein